MAPSSSWFPTVTLFLGLFLLVSRVSANDSELINANANVTIIQQQNPLRKNNNDTQVQFELWTTPLQNQEQTYQNYANLAHQIFGNRINLTPHQYVYNGSKNGCQKDGRNICYDLCTNQGRYCVSDPKQDGVSGTDVIREMLRRICLWKHYSSSTGPSNTTIGSQQQPQERGQGSYWDYIQDFSQHCTMPSTLFTNASCLEGVYQRLNIDGVVIDACVSDSGGTEEDKDNYLLDSEIIAQEEQNVGGVPSIFLNHVWQRGDFHSNLNLFNRICEQFSDGTVPVICAICPGCWDAVGCVQNGYCLEIEKNDIVYDNIDNTPNFTNATESNDDNTKLNNDSQQQQGNTNNLEATGETSTEIIEIPLPDDDDDDDDDDDGGINDSVPADNDDESTENNYGNHVVNSTSSTTELESNVTSSPQTESTSPGGISQGSNPKKDEGHSNTSHDNSIDLTVNDKDNNTDNEESIEQIQINKGNEASLKMGIVSIIVCIMIISFQIVKNPEGICASICRLMGTITVCVLKILIYPLKKIFSNFSSGHRHHLIQGEEPGQDMV